MRHMDEDVGST